MAKILLQTNQEGKDNIILARIKRNYIYAITQFTFLHMKLMINEEFL